MGKKLFSTRSRIKNCDIGSIYQLASPGFIFAKFGLDTEQFQVFSLLELLAQLEPGSPGFPIDEYSRHSQLVQVDDYGMRMLLQRAAAGYENPHVSWLDLIGQIGPAQFDRADNEIKDPER